jgi:hypothetical protein
MAKKDTPRRRIVGRKVRSLTVRENEARRKLDKLETRRQMVELKAKIKSMRG